ncbi:tastin isoform X2 [Sceloporus undulatus]|uniref:tastin isoform X2 n=1 Tax=Sceloporus undulatus TaxID=8520 RepID=UPI001C4B5801|nr:tastin isoform X2 [Sceloporus undulatus]
MAHVGKENQQGALPLPELAWKESVVHARNALSSSKIPVLSKSGVPPERKQLHQRQCWHQQTARGSLYMNVPEGNLVRFSCISKSTSKDSEHPQSCGLALNTQQLKTLSTNLKNIGPRVEAAKPKQTAQDLGVGKSEDPAAKPSTECLTRMTQAGIQSSTGTNEATGSSWKDEEFVPDPVAKASILSNEGLSRFALGANGKLSLAQRVPVKGAQKPPVLCSSTRGESGFLRDPHIKVSSIGKFGRVSCCSTQGLKDLKKSEASGAQLTNTPGDRFSAVDCSPYPLARRVPISCPQSLHPSPWTCHRVPLSSCCKGRRVKVTGSVAPQRVTEGSKQDNTAVPWGKIAVRLFDDEVAASAKKVSAVPVITPEMGTLQCIELLAQLLRQEMNNGSVDRDVAPSLEELHKLLSAHCSPAQPDQLSTLSQNPRPNHCKPTPLSTVVAPETSTTLITPSQDPKPNLRKATPLSTVVGPETSRTLTTASSQPPVYPSTSVHLAQPPSSSASSSGQVKQRLDDLLCAPQRFHEACLNDECAFYTARIMSTFQPSVRRCKDPVAKTLEAHDAMHFIPISAPLSPVEEGERPASS